MQKQTKLHSIVSITVILAFLYPTASLIPVDLTFLTSLPSKIATAFADKPKPEKVELKDQRTANSKTYLNPNGTYTTEISQQPINYKDDGQLKPIDTSLAKDTDGYKVDKNSLQVDFDNKSSNLLQITNSEDNTSINYKVSDSDKAQITPIKKSDNELSYDNYKDGASLNYKVQAGKVKEEIILDKPPADNTFTFELDLKGLKPEQQKDGSIHLVNQKDKISIVIEKPFMTDSHQDAPPELYYSNAVEMQIKPKQGTNFTLTLTADKNWLNDSQRVYPVKIDPNFVTQERSVEDTYIYEADSNANYGGLGRMYIGAYSDNKKFKSLLKYDLRTVPQQLNSQKIIKAELKNIVPDAATNINNGSPYYKGKTTSRIYKVTQPWSESTATWTNMANNYDPLTQVAASDNAVDNQAFDVTQIVRSFQANPSTNYGFLMDNTSIVKLIDDSLPNNPPWSWTDSPVNSGSLASKAVNTRLLASWKDTNYDYFIAADSNIVAWANIQSRPSHLSFSLQNYEKWRTFYMGSEDCYIREEVTNNCEDFNYRAGDVPAQTGTWLKLETDVNSLGLNNENMMINGLFFAALPTGEVTFDDVYSYRKLVFHSSESEQQASVPRLVITYDNDEYGRKPYKTYKEYSGVSTDINNGNLLIESTDLNIKGRGLSTTVTRAYNSYDKNGSRIFGKGFSSYPDSLRVDYNGSIAVLTTQSGAVWAYEQNADGSFKRPKGAYDDLIKNADDTFTLQRKDLSKIEFDSFGRAAREVDKNGNALTFTYGANSRISKIVDAGGKETVFSYLTNDKVSKITDFRGREWVYEYDNVPGGDNNGDTLDRVTDPLGGSVNYRYDASGNLVGIVNPLGGETKVEYNADGRVSKVTTPPTLEYPNGNSITIAYTTQNVTDHLGTKDEKEVAYTKVTEPKGTKTAEPDDYVYIYYFNAEGMVTVAGEPGGSTKITEAQKPFFPGASVAREIMQEFLVYYTCYKKVWVEGGSDESDMDWLDDEEGEWSDFGEGDAATAGGYWVDVPETCSRKEIDWKKENVWNKAWDPQYAKANIPPPEISQPLKHGTEIYYEYDVDPQTKEHRTYNLLKLVNKDKTYTTYEYDANGNVTKEVNHNHEVTDDETAYQNDPLAYQARHKEQTSTYDAKNLLLSQTSSAGDTTTYTYDEKGNLLTETDPANNATSYTYDSFGNQETVTTPKGGITTNSYNNDGEITSVIDPEGVTTTYTYTYDAAGNKVVTEQKVGLGEAKSTYDKMDRLITKKDLPNANGGYKETENIYDAAGNKKKEIENQVTINLTTGQISSYAPKNEVEYTYNELGQLTQQKITFGQTTNYTYDENGNKKTESISNRGPTTYEYDSLNRLIKETKADDSWVAYAYDSFGNVVKEGTPEGTSVNLYDKAGNEVASGDPLGNVSKTLYDKEGNERSTGDGENNITGLNYDANGNIIQTTEEKDETSVNPTAYQYDANQNETKVTAPDSTFTTADYNKADQLKIEADQNTMSTQTNYNTSGLEQTINQPNNMNQELKYDTAGNNTEVNAQGATSTSTNVKTVHDWKGNIDTITTNDQSGNEITKVTNAIQYSNPDNRISSIDDGKRTVIYKYNNIGDIESANDPADPLGKTVYTYDNLVGKLMSLSDGNNKTTTFEYDKAGKSANISKITYPNTTQTSFEYDAASKVTSVSNTKGGQEQNTYRYYYDRNGNIIKTNTYNPNNPVDYFQDDFTVFNPLYWNSADAGAYYDPVGGNMVLQGDDTYAPPADNWFDQAWNRRASVLINNTENPESLTDYQVKVEVDYQPGIKSDFSDLRFTDSDKLTQLPYWIEQKTNATKATIWIKVPSIAADATKLIYMYFGNPNATSTSNGNNVFELFDNFNRSTIGPNWSVVDGSWSIENGQLKAIGAGGGIDAWAYAGDDNWSDYIFEGKAIFLTGQANFVFRSTGHWQDEYRLDIWSKDSPAYPNSIQLYKYKNGVSTTLVSYTMPNIVGSTANVKVKVKRNNIQVFVDDILVLNYADNDPLLNGKVGLGAIWNWEAKFDDVKVRKYSAVEPSSSINQATSLRSWYNEDWAKRAPVEIDNSKNSQTLTDYQVKMEVPYGIGMNSDFSDLRFTDSDKITELPYWIEEKTDSEKATVWIKVPNIAASSIKTIYMYYANPNATSTSDVDKTMDFYDDFNETSLNATKWGSYIVGDGSITLDNGLLRTTANNGTAQIYSKAANYPLNGDIIVERKFLLNPMPNPGYRQRFFLGGVAVPFDQGIFDNETVVWNNIWTSTTVPTSSWQKMTQKVLGSTYYWDIEGVFSASAVATISEPYVINSAVGDGNTLQSGDITTDWIKVRKYTSIEPPVSLGKAFSNKTWYNEDWTKRAEIKVDNSTNSQDLIGYQIKVKVPYIQGIQSDFDDLRFTDSDKITELNYWVEDKKLAEYATVWIKAPQVQANAEKTIYMYYNNPNATSTSNGPSTFEMFNVGGLQSFWKFDEELYNGTSGEVKDQTDANNGTSYNGVSSANDAKFGKAARFDGIDDYVDIPGSGVKLTGSPITISSWVKNNNGGAILEVGACNRSTGVDQRGYGLYSGDRAGQIRFTVNKGLNAYDPTLWDDTTTSETFNDGSWHHVVAVFNADGGTRNKIYVDGTLRTVTRLGQAQQALTSYSSDGQSIGRINTGATYFSGLLDEIEIYNRVLTPNEISALSNNTLQKMGSFYNARKYIQNEPKVSLNLSWWDEDWLKRSAITIDNTENPKDLNDYQLKTTINYQTGMQTDFSDIRFTDSDHLTELAYWIEEKTDATSATVWVRVPEIKASSTKDIYMYYSNPNAQSASNGNAAFKEFDVQNIKGMWKFDEDFYTGAAGEVIDETGINNGTAKNGVITTYDSKFGKAAYFDGYDDYMEILSPQNLDLSSQNFTVEAWSKRLSTDDEKGTIIATGGDFWVQGFILQHRNGGLWAELSDGNGDGVYVNALNKGLYDGAWHHFALVVDRLNNVAYGYIDGKQAVGPVDISSEGDLYNNSTPIRIGRLGQYSTADQYLSGLIDEVKIYDKALTASDISSRYENYLHKINDNNTSNKFIVRNYTSPAPTTEISQPTNLRDWYNSDWKSRAPITIENKNSKTLTDYQVKATVLYKAGMKSDFSDLRFTDSDKITELPYWIERKTDATSATVWIKVPKLTASSTKTLYMYYANPNAASTSDGNAVFEQFDVKGIKALYHLDEESYNGLDGDVKDATKTYSGTSKGNPVSTTDTKFGKAAQFDGTDDTVELGNWMAYQNFTVSMWVNPGETQVQWANIIDNNHRTNLSWEVEQDVLNANRYYWGIGDKDGQDPADLTYFNLTPNQWSFLAMTRDENTRDNKVYVNGRLIGITKGTSLVNYDGSQFLRLASWGGGGRYWKGKMDEVQIYDRALSENEVATQYANYMQKMGSVFNVRKYQSIEPKVTTGDGAENTTDKSNAALLGTKTFSRDLFPSIKLDFLTDRADSLANIVTEGYDGKKYRSLGLVFDNGTIKAQVHDGATRGYPEAIVQKGAQINTWYTAEFDFSPKDAKLYVYKKGDPKPVLPAYTYTEVGWNPNLTFLNYRGKTYIDNVDVKTKAQSTYFVYDDFNRLTKVAGQTGKTPSPPRGEGQGEGVTTYTYDEQGNRLSRITGNGSGVTETTNYTYSQANELLSSTVNGQPSTTYTYDQNGNTLTRSTVNGQPSTSYSYDNKNQLVKVKKEYPDTDLIPDSWQPVNLEPGDGRSAEFAKEGKYSLKIVGSSTKTKSVKQNVATSGSAGDALTFSGWNKTINSSTAGKCVVALFYFNNKDGSRKYAGYLFFGRETHDWRQRSATFIAEKDYSSIDITIGYFYQAGVAYFDDFKLSKVNSSQELLKQPSFELDSDTAEYVYDGKGNRYSKRVITRSPQGDVVISDTFYHYDKDGNIVSETDKDNNLIVRYVRDRAGRVLEMLQANKTYFYVYDGQDHITALTDESGSVVQTYSYDEYGNITNQSGNIYNPIVYTNYYWDNEVSLYHLKTRYYDPLIGRFLTRDKKGNEDQYESAQSSNFYIYAKNNPINMYDPQGKAATHKKWFQAVVDIREAANLTMNQLEVTGTVTWRGSKILDSSIDWQNTKPIAYTRTYGPLYASWSVEKYKAKNNPKKYFYHKAKFYCPWYLNFTPFSFTNYVSQKVKFKAGGKISNKGKARLDKKGYIYLWGARQGFNPLVEWKQEQKIY